MEVYDTSTLKRINKYTKTGSIGVTNFDAALVTDLANK